MKLLEIEGHVPSAP